MSLATETIQAVESQLHIIAAQFEQQKSELSNQCDDAIALAQQHAQQKLANYKRQEQEKLQQHVAQANQQAQQSKQDDIAQLTHLVQRQKDELVGAIIEEVEKVYGSF